MYSTTLGRWIEEDSSHYTDGADLFQMERSNPPRFRDPAGLAATAPATQPATQPDLKLPGDIGEFEYAMQRFQEYIGGPTGLTGTIAFAPGSKCPNCDKIRLIQSIQYYDVNNNKYDVQDRQQGIKQLMTTADAKAGVEGGYIIDFDPAAFPKGPASAYYNDSFPSGDAADGNSVFGTPAMLHDHPYVGVGKWKVRIETVAQCVNTGQYLGSISWGFDIGVDGKAVPITPTVSGTPSASFLAAMKAFLKWNQGR